MSKEDPYRDQAERLRQRIEKIQEASEKKDELPPRGNLHRHKSKKTNLKVKFPVIRLLVLFFILLPITIFSVYSYLEGDNEPSNEAVKENDSGYETINFEKRNDEQKSETKKEDSINEDQQSDVEEKPADASTPSQKVESNKVIPDADKQEATGNVVEEKAKQEQPAVENIPPGNYIYHTVQSQETLFAIAMKYYQSKSGIEIIQKDNGIKNNDIKAGQVLKIRSSSK
ncbi:MULTISPECIES: LysM peptidoglycan-binding domain-containing protein [unclassified Bacillus (in: firmicutes)]|uniref:LysM peptidoglycan-binding domain-containing protein n=1 Tax=unclassified Bacillus (in: firmicutes) TaxID=185979 RepID=UPI0008E8AC24|nr:MULTISPECIES: LysM peptidoglycan-binding domain-containing protein [unclassified Bacillus (in: firmicutes)]SFA98135.1 LysM repeat-containing protein [Bacillus sp. UNCCL13]SFQ80841.1 LysM repeat-containing protein [Bacillus sp. cl95]